MIKKGEIIRLDNNLEYLVVDKIEIDKLEYGYSINKKDSTTMIFILSKNKIIPITEEKEIIKLLKKFVKN